MWSHDSSSWTSGRTKLGDQKFIPESLKTLLFISFKYVYLKTFLEVNKLLKCWYFVPIRRLQITADFHESGGIIPGTIELKTLLNIDASLQSYHSKVKISLCNAEFHFQVRKRRSRNCGIRRWGWSWNLWLHWWGPFESLKSLAFKLINNINL